MFLQDGLVYQICYRCGADFKFAERNLHRADYDIDHCADCKMKPRTEIGELRCVPWQGDYDWDDNPLKPDGTLYRPGKRLCGNKDCVKSTHIEGKVEGERSDLPKIQPRVA